MKACSLSEYRNRETFALLKLEKKKNGMKIFNWMHRKFGIVDNEVPRDFTIGHIKSDIQFSRTTRSNKYRTMGNSFTCFNSVSSVKEQIPESDLFHGLLTIGTLAVPVEILTEEASSELALLKGELLKVVKEEETEHDDAFEIPICVQNRDSTETNIPEVFPLQEYLLATAKEDTPLTRASLVESSTNNKVMETKKNIPEKPQKREKKNEQTKVLNLLKKMCEIGSSNSKNADKPPSLTGRKKASKIRRIFNRKVHPDLVTETTKNLKNEVHALQDAKNIEIYEGRDDILIIPGRPMKSEHFPTCHRRSDRTSVKLDSVDTSKSREYWVKTDANFLVLEL